MLMNEVQYKNHYCLKHWYTSLYLHGSPGSVPWNFILDYWYS